MACFSFDPTGRKDLGSQKSPPAIQAKYPRFLDGVIWLGLLIIRIRPLFNSHLQPVFILGQSDILQSHE